MIAYDIDPASLRSLRERKGHSVPELARRVGVGAQHLYRIEWGRRQPSPRLYRALIEALEVPEGRLLLHKDRAPSESC